MTKAIVDALEIIEVKVEYSKALVQTIESSKGALKSLKKCQTVWQASQLVAANSPLNLNLFSNSLDNLRGIDENRPPKRCHVADHQDRHHKKFRVGAAQNGYGRGNNDRSCECDCRRGDAGQHKCPAPQYTGAKASDNY